MGENGTIQCKDELCQSLPQPNSQGRWPIQGSEDLVLREALEANMVSHTLAATRMIVSKLFFLCKSGLLSLGDRLTAYRVLQCCSWQLLSALPVSQHMDQKMRTIRTFFFLRTFSVSCRVPILARARSRVRAGSAQRQAARPVWVGEVKDFIQGRRTGVCRSRHGPGTS